MNTFSINVNFSSSGFDVNLFNQLDVYFSYYFATALVLVAVALRIRKVAKVRKQNKVVYVAPVKTDDPFADDFDL
jgi:hypothetical protein